MTAGSHSFIDIAVLNGVRERFARGDAIVLLNPELDRVLWANGPGAALFGHREIASARDSDAGLSVQARRQIASLSGYPRIGADRAISLRLNHGPTSRMVTLDAAQLRLPRGELAIMLCQSAPRAGGPDASAAAAISGFSEAGYAAAFIGPDGAAIAATPGFDDLGLGRTTLGRLVENVARKRDRLVKTLIDVEGGVLPVGFARLTDDPALHLLLTAQAPEPFDEDEIEDDPVSVPSAIEPSSHAPETDESRDAPSASVSAVVAPDEASGLSEPTRMDTTESVMSPDRKLPDQPVRFAWRTDAAGRFSEISPDFIEAVGSNAADIIGRSFRDVATVFGFDLDEEISALLDRRDTWSGRIVLWPVQNHALKVPVDLAALPVYDRDRVFEGFRGFGVVRMADAIEDAEALGLALASPPLSDEVSVPEEEEAGDADDKIVRLDDMRPTASVKSLSPDDSETFRKIGTKLKNETAAHAPDTQAEDDGEATDSDRQAQERARFAEDVPSDPATALSDIDDEAATGSATVVHLNVARPDESQGENTPASPEAIESEAQRPLPATLHFLPSAFATRTQGTTDVEDQLIGHLPVATLIHSGEQLHFANPAFFDLTGFGSLDAFADAGGLDALFGAKSDTTDGILTLRRRDGTDIPVKAHLHAVPWHGGKALMLTLVAQEHAEPVLEEEDQIEALRAHLAQFQTIVDTATDGVVLIDNDFAVRSISHPAEALFGFDSAAIEGRAFRELFAIESQRSVQDYVERMAGSGLDAMMNDGREVIGREAEGGFIPLFMTIGRLPMDGGFCAVLRDITQWKRAEEDLTHARAEAERASSQKSEFLARISHEIRTPLNAIIGFSELIINESFGPIGTERYRDYLRDISRSGSHVLDLVNDLLDISKIEAGEQELNYEAVPLNEVLGEAVAMMQPQANRERVIIRSSFASRLPDVVADLRSIRQIALNLLSNAVRYTPAGGQVILSTALEPDGGIAVRVRDTGIGMTAPEIDQALKPFKRVNTLKRSHREGTGLGLPLTKALVEANRARFAISSKPDEGTLVEIDFPATRVLAD